ncbi:unnamed protein product [Orchesella dallaii]|uniref:F-box domain-containing protein n=1 Tax=Orchesella dallaii TaxID=48710 RepID=A0ABP1Q025_9HEXA
MTEETRIEPKLPLEIFSMEVWCHIFSFLPAKDVVTCTHTTQAWSNFYMDERTVLLMQLAFPHISKYLNKAEIAKCRQVCRSWRRGVDDLLQNHPLHYDIQLKSNEVRVAPPTPGKTFTPSKVEELERFIGSWEYGRSNPLSVTRTLSYEEDARDSPNFNARVTYRQRVAVKGLLTVFGSEVWHCRLVFTEGDGPSDLYKRVRSYLILMPNLKTLSIFYAGGHLPPNYVMAPSLQQLVEDEPLPHLNNLVKLCIGVGGPLEFSSLLTFTTLQKLYCANSFNFLPLPVQKQSLNELEQLHAFIINPGDWYKLLNVRSPLKVLKLSIVASARLETVFRCVDNFGETLKHFSLHINIERDVERRISKLLELPELETLKISAGRNKFCNIDFLLPCTSLKNLEMELNVSVVSKRIREKMRRDTTSLDAIVKFLWYEDAMYESNIWELFPHLQNLELNTALPKRKFETRTWGPYPITIGTRYKYNREEYLAHVQRRSRLPIN